MSNAGPDTEDDPGEVEPTDNSSGAPVDLDRVQELEEPPEAAPDR